MRWITHVMRMPQNRIPRKLLDSSIYRWEEEKGTTQSEVTGGSAERHDRGRHNRLERKDQQQKRLDNDSEASRGPARPAELNNYLNLSKN